jgi:hypothetical protein
MKNWIPAYAGMTECRTTAFALTSRDREGAGNSTSPNFMPLAGILRMRAVVVHKELDHPVKPDDDSETGKHKKMAGEPGVPQPPARHSR